MSPDHGPYVQHLEPQSSPRQEQMEHSRPEGIKRLEPAQGFEESHEGVWVVRAPFRRHCSRWTSARRHAEPVSCFGGNATKTSGAVLALSNPGFGVSRGGVGSRCRCPLVRTEVSGFRGEGSGREVVAAGADQGFKVSRRWGQTATSSSALCVVSPFSSRQIPRPLLSIWATNLGVAGRRSTWDQIARKASPSLKSTRATEAAWQASQNTRF
jgi:hypothetical protein